jgi:hypothetical protein
MRPADPRADPALAGSRPLEVHDLLPFDTNQSFGLQPAYSWCFTKIVILTQEFIMKYIINFVALALLAGAPAAASDLVARGNLFTGWSEQGKEIYLHEVMVVALHDINRDLQQEMAVLVDEGNPETYDGPSIRKITVSVAGGQERTIELSKVSQLPGVHEVKLGHFQLPIQPAGDVKFRVLRGGGFTPTPDVLHEDTNLARTFPVASLIRQTQLDPLTDKRIRKPGFAGRVVLVPGKSYDITGNLRVLPRPHKAAAGIRPMPSMDEAFLVNLQGEYGVVWVPGNGPGGVTPMPPYPFIKIQQLMLRAGNLSLDLVGLAKLLDESVPVQLSARYNIHLLAMGQAPTPDMFRPVPPNQQPQILTVDKVTIRGLAVGADLPLNAARIKALAIQAVRELPQLHHEAVRPIASIDAELLGDLTVKLTVHFTDGGQKSHVYDALLGRLVK